MLKDIEDSKRTNTAVHSALTAKHVSAPKTVDFVIVSDHYWPSIPSDHMNYHPYLQSLLDEYQGTYAILKKPRKLHYLESTGSCDLDLTFNDGTTRSFSCSAVQVS
jgi:hypothetical protein